MKEKIAGVAGLDQAAADRRALSHRAQDGPESELRNPTANVLTISVLTNDAAEQLPIIDVQAQAVDADRAAALANAAAKGLGEYLDSKAAAEAVSEARRLRVRALGAATAQAVSHGPGRMMSLVATIVVFCGLCGGLLAVRSLAQGWRAATAFDGAGFDAEESSMLFPDARMDPPPRCRWCRRPKMPKMPTMPKMSTMPTTS